MSFSCLCPELVINANVDDLATDLVGASLYYQVSSHFGDAELYQAYNQYRAMVKSARERERNDSRNLLGANFCSGQCAKVLDGSSWVAQESYFQACFAISVGLF